ncbi:MAG: hypothetical protein BVN31_09800 [Proteobacteria bacterium ST_bin15]|nr:MAG: hypothetical protein BVN31_09800 [Proteobacteria bacterium ST_bin15]
MADGMSVVPGSKLNLRAAAAKIVFFWRGAPRSGFYLCCNHLFRQAGERDLHKVKGSAIF